MKSQSAGKPGSLHKKLKEILLIDLRFLCFFFCAFCVPSASFPSSFAFLLPLAFQYKKSRLRRISVREKLAKRRIDRCSLWIRFRARLMGLASMVSTASSRLFNQGTLKNGIFRCDYHWRGHFRD